MDRRYWDESLRREQWASAIVGADDILRMAEDINYWKAKMLQIQTEILNQGGHPENLTYWVSTVARPFPSEDLPEPPLCALIIAMDLREDDSRI